MKTKTRLLLVLLLGANCALSFAQTTTIEPAPDAATEVPLAAVAPEVPPPDPLPEGAVADVDVAAPEPAPAVAEVPVVEVAPATESAAVLPEDAVAVIDSANEIVPLITIPEAALPEVINILARQAAINFQFDPKVLNPAPDASGKIPAQPLVSIRFENVTAQQALTAVLDNYNLQMVKDPKTSIARITVKDPASLEPLLTRVFDLQYSSPSNLVPIVTTTISARGKVMADPRTSKLVITATEKELEAVEELLAELDTQTKQILIEARFLEINQNPRTSKGVDWTDTLSQQNITFGNGISAGVQTVTRPGTSTSTTTPGDRTLTGGSKSSTTSVIDTFIGGETPGITANTADGFNPSTFFLNADGVKVALAFLNSDADAESIATPRAVTLENVPTELSVVRNIPVFEQEQGANVGGSVSANTVKPNYLLAGPNGSILNEIGIKLLVTPRVYGGSNVFLDLRPEISDREARPETTVLNDQVNSAPIFARRKLQTQAMIPSGYTLVLGGLRQDISTKTFTKVPFFGDLPGIGLMFRRDEKSRDKRDLVIFVTPTIIETQDFQQAANSREFLQQKMVEKTDTEWSAWDSGKPADWTKPDNSVKPRYTPGK